MYESFFSLTENPFALSPDPRYMYLSPGHAEVLNCLLYGIQEKKGFIAVTGSVGTGKTTLCRFLLSELDDSVKTALIFNPSLSDIELLETVTEEFGIKIGSGKGTKKTYIDALNDFLLRNFSDGNQAVLIIDEAQNLSHGAMEQIRMLSNLETATEKLLQIVLLGQPELMEMLALPSLRQLNERIVVRCELKALAKSEVRRYIERRISTAAADAGSIFTAAACDEVYRASGGIPRRINAICDRGLLIAYAKDKKRVDRRIVRAAIRDLGRGYLTQTAEKRRRQSFEAAVALLLWAIMLLLGYGYLFGSLYRPGR